VILPASWLAYAERQAGERIEEVTIEVNGQLTIKPYIPEKQGDDSR
jgi:hypothetical protein